MDLLKTGQVAKILGVNHCEVRKLFEIGLIKGYNTSGGHRKYYSDSVYEYKASITPKDPKYTLVYLIDSENTKEEEEIQNYCEILKCRYEVIYQNKNPYLKQESIKRIIEHIEKEDIDRVIFGSFDREDIPIFKCIEEIAKYHNVQVINFSDIEGGGYE